MIQQVELKLQFVTPFDGIDNAKLVRPRLGKRYRRREPICRLPSCRRTAKLSITHRHQRINRPLIRTACLPLFSSLSHVANRFKQANPISVQQCYCMRAI